MPYIPQNIRAWFDEHIEKLFTNEPLTVGDINYIVTKIMLRYANQSKGTPSAIASKYTASVMIIGTVVCAVLEFYRRYTTQYEDDKIKENGDVY